MTGQRNREPSGACSYKANDSRSSSAFLQDRLREMARVVISLSVSKQDCRKMSLCYIDPSSNIIMSDRPGSVQRSCEELQSNTKEDKSPLTRPCGPWDEAEVLGCLLDSVLGSSVIYTVNLLSVCECDSEGLKLTLNVLHKIQHQQLNGIPDLAALV